MQRKVKKTFMKTAAPRVKRQLRARFVARPKKGQSATPAPEAADAAGHGPSGPDVPANDSDGAGDAVAELEAVIGHDDEAEEPAEKREAEEPSNFLAMYFK